MCDVMRHTLNDNSQIALEFLPKSIRKVRKNLNQFNALGLDVNKTLKHNFIGYTVQPPPVHNKCFIPMCQMTLKDDLYIHILIKQC